MRLAELRRASEGGASAPAPRDQRQVFDGIWWRARTGSPWRDVPGRYGPPYARRQEDPRARDLSRSGPAERWKVPGVSPGPGRVRRLRRRGWRRARPAPA
ncbi:transposase [Streptomyces sp. NPDC051136]|uniref:transposase n=1 Tax=Streptomyces sp. NPDC051136 TaxID=3365643 RepID=UPI00378CAB2C